MVSDIKIGVLGASGAGQMCYLIAMYATLRKGVNNFSLKAREIYDDIYLSDQWKEMIYSKEPDRWPPCTSNCHYYYFDFSYRSQKLIGIDWLNCVRGALYNLSTDTYTSELLNHVNKSSCLFLIFSGAHLTENLNLDRQVLVSRHASISRQLQFLGNRLRNFDSQDSKKFPVVILITKYDLCASRKREEIINDIKKYYEPLFLDMRVVLLILPVSLGKELAENRNGEIEPINVHYPIFFAIYFSLLESWQKYEKEIAILAHELRNYLIYSGGKEIMLND